jgi:hypothetical protein
MIAGSVVQLRLVFGRHSEHEDRPYGLRGYTPTQSWFIQQPGFSMSGMSSVFGNQSSTLQSSDFDASYTNLANGTFTAQILGNVSFLHLSNGTYIGLPDGTSFGSLAIASTTEIPPMAASTLQHSEWPEIGLGRYKRTTEGRLFSLSTPSMHPQSRRSLSRPAHSCLVQACLASAHGFGGDCRTEPKTVHHGSS